eukprot:gnl/TRDRNA2_/TRDRNA2_176348_c0_seq2.p1 gnl/TRDRNA2_/TRDRNA2_176348_c0~~gnl/TRDRNA2_/TRDRNA2_176348_c0_seq2.p1  ORF type:complete len:441 (-),score=-35.93 gnl/TRDRNA2_/TRDRNA2_176348_c0_seq2:286-1608(-)
MIRVEGIVTKATLVTPKLCRSVHYCPTSKKHFFQNHYETVLSSYITKDLAYLTKDNNTAFLETEYGLSKYIDCQTMTVQETPETAPSGQIPRFVDVSLEGDLVDCAKPGDRVSVVGIYREVQKKSLGLISGILRAIIIANQVEVLLGQFTSLTNNLSELQAIRNFIRSTITKTSRTRFNRLKMLDMLAASISPSIYGHYMIKRALVLQLVGGNAKTLANNSHLRGDINILLVGDPGVAKSQLLRAVMRVSPLAVSTTGRGSSGVGLTAAVIQDKETGERRLEAGAMVLGDKGIVLIDEFDKMSENDRVAVHEVMEQQSVTIAKAGLLATLKARCSILAASNPMYGRYDASLTVNRNINMPDSLLSRFDLLFIMTDLISNNNDRNIAHHLLSIQSFAEPIYATKSLGSDIRNHMHGLESSNVDESLDELDNSIKFFISNNK